MYRIIIADDERAIREGICKLIDWESMNCQIVCKAENGKQVISYLETEEADIVVCDIKMPRMDGIRLLKELEEHSDIMTVVLTAYSEFEFAQNAIRYGAFDYIIKNNFMSELPKTILRMIEKLEEKKENKLRKESEKKAKRANYLESVIQSKIVPKEKETEFLSDGTNYCVCRCEITYEAEYEQRQEIAYAMENFFSIAVNAYEHYLIEVQKKNMTIIFCAEEGIDFSVKNVTIVLAEVIRVAEDFMRLYIKFGVSEICEIENLQLAYKQATQALFHITAPGNEILLYTKEDKEKESKDSVIQCSARAVDALMQKKFKEAESLLEDMKKNAVSSRQSLQEVRVNAINIASMVFRKLEERYILENVKQMEITIYNKISESTTLYTIFNTCTEVFLEAREMIEADKLDKHYLIDAMNRYIQEHCNQNITLQDISEALHISPSYISRLYKKKTGITLTNAINQLRVNQSKELLKDTSYKIYEVAQAVGIEDAGYFTNLFIKYEGCTPSEYRGVANPKDNFAP